MKRILFVLVFLFLCASIRVDGIEISDSDYLKEIKNNEIVIGVQNKDENLQNFRDSHLAKYLKEELNLNVRLKKVSEKEGKYELLAQKIDFLENANFEDNPNIKYLNYNFFNNIIIVCREDCQYNAWQLSCKKVGMIDRECIKNCKIYNLSRNNNIKLYKDFKSMAKALENKDIDLGISDREDRFEVILYKNLKLCSNDDKSKWKEGIATNNPRYYRLINIINNSIYKEPNLIKKIFNTKDDYKKIIDKAFYESLNKEEKEYIKNTKAINVLAKENSFPIFYEQGEKNRGILNYFMNSFNRLTNIKINYLVDGEECTINNDDTIKEDICYEKNIEIPNIIYKSSLSIICLNDYIAGFNSFDLIDKNKIGMEKAIKLNPNNKLLRNNIKYYKDFDETLKAMKNKEVNFIVVNQELFDYYQLKENDKDITKFENLEIPTKYYLTSNNKVLSSILNKAYKIYDMEKEIDREKWWIAKDYMRKEYITALSEKKEFYKILTVFSVGMLGVLIVFIIIGKRNIDKKNDTSKKLDKILERDSNLDIVEINLKNETVECKSGIIFDNKKSIVLNEFLSTMNLDIKDYLYEDKRNKLKQAKEFLINGETKYFKQCVYPSNNKKITSIITDVTQEVKEKIELQEKIRIDTLTGLINRDYYEKEIEKIINKSPSYKGAFIFIDINDFKKFNDEFGHDFGDKVIKLIGHKLKSVESSNTLAFRIAGDEFGIYKHKIERKEDITNILKDLCKKLTIERDYNDFNIKINCSIGCAVSFEEVKNIGILRNSAEAQMYKCKNKKDMESKYKISYFKD